MGWATDYVHNSIQDLLDNLEEGETKEYEKYADYYDGRPENVEKYFVKRHMETKERFKDRPKLSWPICRLIVDAHAEALAGDIEISIEDETTAEVWREIAEYNQVPAFLKNIATIIGVYGACGVKPFLFDDNTKEKRIEFEAYPPDVCKFVYDRNSGGRSVKHYPGVGIVTGYSMANGKVLPAHLSKTDPALAAKLDYKQRTEYITRNDWEVYLDEKLTPRSPWGEQWQPAQDGSNPYKEVMVALFNALETHESFLGVSDIHHSIYDVQTINVLWSDLVYMHMLYVPIFVLNSRNSETREFIKSSGIGTGIALDVDEKFGYSNANIDFSGVEGPVKVALEIMYSNAKLPAAAVGLGHLFRNQQVSGVAKEYEYKATIAHAEAKQPIFTRGIKQMVRQALTIAAASLPYGQSKKCDPNAQVDVKYTNDIVPTSKIEQLEKMGKEILNGVRSVYGSMIQYHGWSPERAARELDLIAAEHKRHLVEDLGMKDIVEIVDERQKVRITTEQRKAAEEVLFSAMPGLGSDMTAGKEDDDEETVRGANAGTSGFKKGNSGAKG